MTDQPIDEQPTDDQPELHAPADDLRVEVRRNVGLAAGVGGFAALMTVAFGVRAFTGGTALDWCAFAVLAVIAVAHLAAVVDGRAPLLVADPRGVRLREGSTWRGIAWEDIDCLEHLPRRGVLRDGHLLVDGYDDRQLVVPLTLATRLVGATPTSLSDVLAALSNDRADVVEVVPGLVDDNASAPAGPRLSDLYTEDSDRSEDPVHTGPANHPDHNDPGESERRDVAARPAAGPSADVVSGDEDGREDTDEILLDGHDVESTDEIPAVRRLSEPAHAEDVDRDSDETDDSDGTPPTPGRDTVFPARVELDRPAAVRDPLTDPLEERSSDQTTTVVLDELLVRPAPSPVVGPELVAARQRLRLSIDQLSERTRIRPHVIEAMEVDDFAPCGGDFYARGHLRTLGRVLGIDAAPLVESYDEHYAHAPVDARRVFESELATGAGGVIRGTRGGRNWSALVAGVMGVVLIWSVAQLLMGGPQPVGDTPVLNQSGGISKAAAAQGDPVRLTLVAAGGGAQLVIRDAAGEIVFDGNLAFGQTSKLDVVPPVRIWTSDGSVTYAIGDAKPAPLGDTGSEASKTLVAP